MNKELRKILSDPKKRYKLRCCLCVGEIDHHTRPDGNGGEEVYWTEGHNPEPLSSLLGIEDGRCCDSCNYEKVIPARLLLMRCGNDRKLQERLYDYLRKQHSDSQGES